MTAPLAGALVLSALTGVTVSWLFIAWPRRISAEEWIVHRRSFQRAHDTTKQFGRLSILRTGSVAGVALMLSAASVGRGATLSSAGLGAFRARAAACADFARSRDLASCALRNAMRPPSTPD